MTAGDGLASRHGRRPYKPIPLRWPFLVVQMVLLAVAIAAVVALERLMPDSDDSALVQRQKAIWSSDSPGQQPTQRRRRAGLPRDGLFVNVTTTASSIPTSTPTAEFPPQFITEAFVRVSGTATVTTTITREFQGDLAGVMPTISTAPRPKLPGQKTIATNRTRTTYNTADATTSRESVVREKTDFLALNGPQTADIDADDAGLIVTMGEHPPVFAFLTLGGIVTIDFPVTTIVPVTEQKSDVGFRVNAVVETQSIVTELPVPSTTVVRTPPPETLLRTIAPTIATITTTPPPTTVVATSDGVVVTSVVTPPPTTILSTVEKSVMTIVQTRPPETIVTVMGGVPVTLLAIVSPAMASPVTETVVAVLGGTKTTVTPRPVTQTTIGLRGGMITLTSTPPPYVTITGGITTTITRTSVLARAITTALVTTINGTPTTISLTLTPTATAGFGDGVGSINGPSTRVYPGMTSGQYFAAVFLPTMLAVVLALPFAIIDLNAKLMQPFRALARPDGASGPDSMTLSYGGVHNFTTPVKQLFRGHPVPFLTTLLTCLSWLMAPLAAEAIGLKVHGTCSHLSISGCAVAVGVSPLPAHALIAVMVIMLALLMPLTFLLHRWDTGVSQNPWSLAEIAVLSRSHALRARLERMEVPTERGLNNVFRRGRFQLGVPQSSTNNWHSKDQLLRHPTFSERQDYSLPAILPVSDDELQPPLTPPWHTNTMSTTITTLKPTPSQPNNPRVPFPALTYASRTIFILLLLGLMTLLIYYHLSHGDTPFELFMDSQQFGVKFLFAALGTVFSLFFASFFLGLAALAPFSTLSRPSAPARRTVQAVLATPTTNPFSGACTALAQNQPLLFCAACMAVLAELLPVLLANIPYALTQTLLTHTVCTYLALGVLGAMVLVLGGTVVLVRWPDVPLDPRTVGGAVFYVAGSEGLVREVVAARGGGRELDGRYFYGGERVDDAGGRGRMVVDVG
ncbi:hypothetical protein B0T18DRAFT_490804 [Schizothecium vesticola]|uniref:Zonadhesin n=1 Tax=Schizothecium vesticola TaxID=314040 RepID=A0AA40BTD0_9PEZI|nr:hypothetical protein B0T18DRAFT_490804 [Schizothecium vesticola]